MKFIIPFLLYSGLGLLFVLSDGQAVQKDEAVIKSYKGRQVIFLNNRPIPPLMYSGTEGSRETWTGLPRKSIEEFSNLGYRIIQTDLWFKYSLGEEGRFDMAGIQKQLRGILDVNPQLKIVVRINVSAPKWWLKQNPGEICKVTVKDPKSNPYKIGNAYGANIAESLASDKYREFAKSRLKEFLVELSKTPEGDHVIGFHIGGGVYGEWHYYGMFHEPDASEAMTQKWIEFSKAKYGSIESLNLSWKRSLKSWEEIKVPSFEQRFIESDGDFRDPEKDQFVMDYYLCQQKIVNSLLIDLAKLTKETWNRPAIVGLFYAYFYGGFTVGAQSSQWDIEPLLSCPYVDYFAGPYASRNVYGSGIFRTLVQSISLHGKLWLCEHDGGTFLGNVSNSTFPSVPRTESETVARMRRNFMYSLTEGAGQWWYDFGPKNKSGWWSTPRLLKEAQDLLSIYQKRLDLPFTKNSEVLVVHDIKSFNHVMPAVVDKLTPQLTELLTNTVLQTGAASDRVFLMDLDQLDLNPYKVIIFANTFALTEIQRVWIKNNVFKNGRSVIFISGAGYSDGKKNSTDHLSDLVGMTIEKSENKTGSMQIKFGEMNGKFNSRDLKSHFKITDKNVSPMGFYDSGEVAAAIKQRGDSTVYYFGTPPDSSIELFKTIFKGAGVKIWIENMVPQDYCSVGGGIIGLYSVQGGEKIISNRRGRTQKISFKPFTTLYFDIESGALLNRTID